MIIAFDIGDVLLPGRNPMPIWEELVPDDAERSQTLAAIGYDTWSAEWDASTFAACIANKVRQYPVHATLIQKMADHWVATSWGPVDHDVIDIVRALKTTSAHKLLLASNWPSDDFERAQKDMAPFLPLFDGAFISGHEGVIKPHEAFFKGMMARFDFAARDSVFIDDRAENVQGARRVGMQGIVFKNAPQLRASLQEIGIL